MDFLGQTLQNTTNLSNASRSAVTTSFWGKPPESLYNNDLGSGLDCSAYFEYYVTQCREASHDGGKCISITCHRDIVGIVELIKKGLTRNEIEQSLIASSPRNTAERYNGSINLAASLMVMSRFGSCRHVSSPHTKLDWTEGSMRQFLEKYFAEPPKLGHIRLNKDFNARSLSRIAAIEVVHTDNLADHLSLGNNEKSVKIFGHVSFLEYQKNESIFPEGFIDETLRTIALLFPQERGTAEWVEKQSTLRMADPRLVRCGQLRSSERHIERFNFWHDRLVILKEAYDESSPATFSQWWNDQRNGERWYTFWVAVVILSFTIFFGIVQSIEGALQVYKAYHPSK